MAEKDGARRGLQILCRYGCHTALLPYRWDPSTERLCPGSRSTIAIFNINKNATIMYLAYMWFRLIQVYLQGEFSLRSGLWAVSSVSTISAQLTMAIYKKEVMQIANLLLSNSLLGSSGDPPQNKLSKEEEGSDLDESVNEVEHDCKRIMAHHMYFNLLLLYTNPEVHSLIVYQNPCAINFISSLVYPCQSAMDHPPIPIWEQVPFLMLEAYVTTKWQIVCSFMWCCMFLGFAVIGMEMKKLGTVILKHSSRAGHWNRVLLQMRKCELAAKLINSTFHIYLTTLPAVGVVVVSMLLFGTIRLWRIDPESNVMFPLCAIRCGFEALTPLAMAGKLHDLSESALAKWKEFYDTFQFYPRSKGSAGGSDGGVRNVRSIHGKNRLNGRSKNLVIAMQRSCRKIECSSGPLFSFESSIVLTIVDNCVQNTVNLLVSFPARM